MIDSTYHRSTRIATWVFALASAASFGACSGSDSEIEGDTRTEGQTQYKDAETDSSGASQDPAQPDAQTMEVEIRMAGSGSLSGLQPECELEGATGEFTGLLEGSGEIDSSGAYLAVFAMSDGTFTTPSGSCQIPDLSISTLTEVSIRGKLENTTENCNTYCDAKARSEAEAECGSSADSASCRASFEADYAASCKTSCSGSTTRRIVAETALSVDALATLNAGSLGVSGLGTIEADLTFDRIEESDGEAVDEAP